jgi:hypothetical protein
MSKEEFRLIYLRSVIQAESYGGDFQDCLLHYLLINLEIEHIQ